MKKISLTILCLISIILVLSHSPIVADGVKTGIELCLYQVIPSLLPFILISNIMLNQDLGSVLSKAFYPLLHKLYGVTRNGSFAIILSYLSGFPVGARTISRLYETSKISKNEACHLMTFCNNASISFVINYLGIYCLKGCVDLKLLLFLIYAPPLLTGVINRYFFKYNACALEKQTDKINIITSTLSALGKISVFVISFSVIAALLQSTSVPYIDKITVLLEITTGLSHITKGIITYPIVFSAIICTIFGGLCTMFQAFSFLCNYHLKKYYIIGKIEQIIITVLLLLYFK